METRGAAKRKREVRGGEGAGGDARSPPLTRARAWGCPAQDPLPFWFKAAKQGDAETPQQLAPSVDVNAQDGWEEEAALHLAVCSGSLAAVEVVLAAGANPSIATKHQYQPLHLAAKLRPPSTAVPIIKACWQLGQHQTHAIIVAARQHRRPRPVGTQTL